MHMIPYHIILLHNYVTVLRVYVYIYIYILPCTYLKSHGSAALETTQPRSTESGLPIGHFLLGLGVLHEVTWQSEFRKLR